jgi:hypothetical protein
VLLLVRRCRRTRAPALQPKLFVAPFAPSSPKSAPRSAHHKEWAGLGSVESHARRSSSRGGLIPSGGATHASHSSIASTPAMSDEDLRTVEGGEGMGMGDGLDKLSASFGSSVTGALAGVRPLEYRGGSGSLASVRMCVCRPRC